MAGRPKKLALPAGQRFQGLFGLPDVIGTGPRRPGRPAKKPKHDDANPESQTPDPETYTFKFYVESSVG